MTLNGVLIKKVICTGPNETIPGNISGTFLLSLCFYCTCHGRCIHIYAVGIYICMHVAECAIQSERLVMCRVCAVSLATRESLCVVAFSALYHAFREVYVRRLWIEKNAKCFSKSDCWLENVVWFYYRTPNCTPVLLRLLYRSPDQVGYDHELYVWGAPCGWWEIWNPGAGQFYINSHIWYVFTWGQVARLT